MDFKINPTMPLNDINLVTDPTSATKLNNIADPKQRAEAVADQLERTFMNMMVKAMRKTVPDGGLMGRGLGGQQYVEMLDQQITQMGQMPRDPRFHEALVRQIMNDPGSVEKAMDSVAQRMAAGTKEENV